VCVCVSVCVCVRERERERDRDRETEREYVFVCLGGRGNSGDKPQTNVSLKLVHAAAQDEESAQEEMDIYTILCTACCTHYTRYIA
jgi:hypothetical protein